MKFVFSSESFKRKFISNLFACNLITGCFKKNSKYLGSKCDKSVQQIQESMKQKGKLTGCRNTLRLFENFYVERF